MDEEEAGRLGREAGLFAWLKPRPAANSPPGNSALSLAVFVPGSVVGAGRVLVCRVLCGRLRRCDIPADFRWPWPPLRRRAALYFIIGIISDQ